jgi:hypothetical protein
LALTILRRDGDGAGPIGIDGVSPELNSALHGWTGVPDKVTFPAPSKFHTSMLVAGVGALLVKCNP